MKKIVTEFGVYNVLPEGGFELIELAPGVTVDQVKNATSGKLIISENVKEVIL